MAYVIMRSPSDERLRVYAAEGRKRQDLERAGREVFATFLNRDEADNRAREMNREDATTRASR